MANKILFLDVDGVLVESSGEILLTSWNEYNAWQAELGLPHAAFSTTLDAIPASFRHSREAFLKNSHKTYYRTAINLFTLAGFDPGAISAELIAQISEADPDRKQATLARVQQQRERLRAEGDLASLSTAYAEVDYAWLDARMAAGEVYLLTNNAFSIDSLAAVAWRPDPVWVRGPHGDSHNKAHHINEICAARDVLPEHCLFVDDNLSSLQDVAAGTSMPDANIIQNRWSDKLPAQTFARLDWQGIVARFEAL